MLIHLKDVPDIDLLKLQKAINHIEEVTELDCETVHATQIESDGGDNSEKLVYHRKIQDGVKGGNNNRLNHAQVSKNNKNLLNRLGITVALGNSVVKEDERIQEQVNKDNAMMTGCTLGSNNSDKSLVCYNQGTDEGGCEMTQRFEMTGGSHLKR